MSPYALAEVDHLVATRLGVDAERAALGELAGGPTSGRLKIVGG